MPTLPPALVRELGSAQVAEAAADGVIDPGERTRELTYPGSLYVYEQMRRSDTGIRAALRAVKLPILSTRWQVLPSPGVREPVREFVEVELGLHRDETGRLRSRAGGVQWNQFLSEALTCLEFGHAFFEQVYAAGAPDTPGLVVADGLPLVAHLRKLAPRPQPSLSSIDVAHDGGLEGITQQVRSPGTGIVREVKIPVDRLVAFVNEREGAIWSGTSVLRSAYKNWMIRDVLIRLSAIAVDRTGMGLPVVTYDEAVPGAKAMALKIATQVRGGEDAGVALPEGMALTLLGVTGTTMDPLPLIRYHEQAASKAVLAMFLDLGHDTGARSLGDTFVDYFLLGVQAVTEMLESTITDHVVRDLVRLNFGENEPWPVVRADPINAEATPTAGALSQLALAGLLGPITEQLVQDIRRRYDLPPLAPGEFVAPTAGGGELDLPDDPAGVVDEGAGGPGYVPAEDTSGGSPIRPAPPRSPGANSNQLVPGIPGGTGAAAARVAARTLSAGPQPAGWDAELAARVQRLSAAVASLGGAP